MTYAFRKRPDLARPSLLASLAIEPSPLVYNGLGLLDYDAGRIEPAAAYFEQALDLDPKSAEALYNLGLVRLSQRRPHQAAAFWREVLSTDAHFVLAHFNLAVYSDDVADTAQREIHVNALRRLGATLPTFRQAR